MGSGLAIKHSPFTIIAGERRYRAAKAAKLKEVPAQVRNAGGEALTLAVADNVIRADLSPVEEAEAYRRLVEEHGDAMAGVRSCNPASSHEWVTAAMGFSP